MISNLKKSMFHEASSLRGNQNKATYFYNEKTLWNRWGSNMGIPIHMLFSFEMNSLIFFNPHDFFQNFLTFRICFFFVFYNSWIKIHEFWMYFNYIYKKFKNENFKIVKEILINSCVLKKNNTFITYWKSKVSPTILWMIIYLRFINNFVWKFRNAKK